MHYEYLSTVIGQAGSAARAVAEWAADMLAAVLDGRLPVAAVSHPLGFSCLPVERAGRDGVCVHVWSPRLPRTLPTTSAIHAHCWQLTSVVLFGQLENRLLTVADVPRAGGGADAAPAGTGLLPSAYRVLEVRSHGDVDELRPTPRLVRCLPGQRQVMTGGDVYSVPAGAFHATDVPPGTETATVVLGRMVPGIADWSLGLPDTDGHRVCRSRCDQAQTGAVARVVLDRLLARWPTAVSAPARPTAGR